MNQNAYVQAGITFENYLGSGLRVKTTEMLSFVCSSTTIGSMVSLELRGLTKRFGSVVAVDRADLSAYDRDRKSVV